MRRRLETWTLAALAVWALAFAAGCYSTHASLDGVVRVNRATGEVCIYAIEYEEGGQRFVDVYCEE